MAERMNGRFRVTENFPVPAIVSGCLIDSNVVSHDIHDDRCLLRPPASRVEFIGLRSLSPPCPPCPGASLISGVGHCAVIHVQFTCRKHVLLYLCRRIPPPRTLPDGGRIHRGRKGTSERLSNPPKATQRPSSSADTGSQVWSAVTAMRLPGVTSRDPGLGCARLGSL